MPTPLHQMPMAGCDIAGTPLCRTEQSEVGMRDMHCRPADMLKHQQLRGSETPAAPIPCEHLAHFPTAQNHTTAVKGWYWSPC